MSDFFVLIWFASIVTTLVFGINFIVVKANKTNQTKKLKLTDKQLMKYLIISAIVSFVTFIGIGITAPPQEENEYSSLINEIMKNELLDIQSSIFEQNQVIENEVNNEANNEEIIKQEIEDKKVQSLSNIPKYEKSPYVVINGNKPFFTDSDFTTKSYESYSSLDGLGRCGVAIANIGKDLMPTEERGNIGSVKPTGWHTIKYNGIDGNYLYNRCHLIGFQLTGENANEKNLITGTRYMNTEGMLPFENMVADYIKETNNHVLYRVTPIFEKNNLLASGVLMEAKSIEDNGKGIEFNVYCYNVQPNIEIDYATGESSGEEYTGTTTSNSSNNTSSTTTPSNSGNASSTTNPNDENNSSNDAEKPKTEEPSTEQNPSVVVPTSQNYILNTNTKKFHEPSCGSAKKISAKNKQTYVGTRNELISRGYSPCGNCDP